MHNLQGAWSQMWRQLNVVTDTKLTRAISSSPSLEDFALSTLGITKQDLERIEEEKRDRKEYIRKVIESSDPSFGRFMTQVYEFYQRLRSNGGRDGSKTILRAGTKGEVLKLLRQQVGKQNMSDEDVFELCLLLYKFTRAKSD